ncbi:hypothetical protein [Peribacillus faecalis]|nr:hypothetical protein [Peribacillus faecalis]
MKKKELKPFPGQQKGMIQILIKHSKKKEAVQLRFDLDFGDSDSN